MAKRHGSIHVATTKRRYKGKVYTTHLLRRSYRQDGKVKHQTLGNLSHLPEDMIELIRRRLRGEPVGGPEQWAKARTYPHGHVAAVLGTLRSIGLEQMLGSRRCRQRDLVVAMIASRILHPGSKLANARALADQTAQSSLALELQLDGVDTDELYQAMDWLLARQNRIENKLAKAHLQDGTLMLYDVSSSYYTGRCSDLVQYGHNRDGKKGYPQIIYGLLCSRDGCPIAIEVFPGNTGDPKTLDSQIRKLRKRFGIQRVVMVGDRGMITSRRIDDQMRDVEGLDWISALRADQLKKLAAQGTIDTSLFDEQDLAEVQSEDFPGERLILCRNPALAHQRAQTRQALLEATEAKLEQIAQATKRTRRPLRGKDKIAVRVGRVLGQSKVAKHFQYQISEDSFCYQRRQDKIDQEAALDGLYVIRTSVQSEDLSDHQAVSAYKDLAKVERAFRSMKTVDLKVRPIHHWLEDRIRAHVFICMLAYYVEWHMRQKLAPMLFDDHDREAAEAQRPSPVAPAPRSDAAKAKDATQQTADGEPVLSFQDLLAHLATLTKDRLRLESCQPADASSADSAPTDAIPDIYMLTDPTAVQQRALDLLEVTADL